MESLKKHYLSLIVIILLAAIKFAVIPLLNWQNEMILSNSLLTKKLFKSSQAIDNQDLYQLELSKIEQQLNQGEQLFFNYTPQSLFQLTQQKNIEQLFNQHNIKINGFRWKVPQTKKQWQLILNEVKISFKGTVIDLQQLQMSLESQKQWFDNYDFNYTLDVRHEKRLGKVSGRMSLKLYMREKS
jgi:hypothetical protein